jgi:6-phosphogluconate dehydrogenase
LVLLAIQFFTTMAATPETLIVKPEFVGQCDVGIIGLGTMGYNLAINILDKGFTVAVYNRSYQKSEKFLADYRPTFGDSKVFGAQTFEDFAKLLKKPRKALILVEAGPVTEAAIENLSKVFEAEDIIVDTGNAHFKDQSGRAAALEAKGLRFLGMGVSGGAEGARKGPAFFPGGTLSIWAEIQPIVEAASAKAKSDGRPCVTMCGKGGAGSCVKMYHNAGEYAVLQIWGEAVVAMKNRGMSGDDISAVLKTWKARGDLDSYMLDITIEVAGHKSAESGSGFLSDIIGDAIGSKGTGLWSVQVAMEVGCPAPSLAAAVVARQTSMAKAQRKLNANVFGEVANSPVEAGMPGIENEKFCEDLYWAVYLAIVASYGQMYECLRYIDRDYQLEIMGNLPRIISTFRAGCILQGAMLEPMTRAFESDPNIPNLMCAFRPQMEAGMPGFRSLCARAALSGEPLPVIQASLGYMIQMSQTVIHAAQIVSLQRDVFGRHGFKKLKDGDLTAESFNEEWPEMQ